MPSEVVQAAEIVGGGLAGGGLASLFRVGARNRRDDADSAHVLAKAYALLVDDLKTTVHDQGNDIKELREEFRRVVVIKDQEIAALRQELANERAESGRLRQRVAELEAKVSVLSSVPK